MNHRSLSETARSAGSTGRSAPSATLVELARLSTLHRFLRRVATGALAAVPIGAASQAVDPAANPAHGELRYAIGPKFSSTWGGVDHPIKVRPSAGIAYGRWKLGSIPSDQWLQLSGLFKEPALSYDALRTARRNIGVSLRLHDLDRQESSDGLPSRRTTIRGRLVFSYVLTEQWSLLVEATQDLQRRGDGTTAGIGLARGIELGARQRLSLSASTTWATGEHWSNVYRKQLRADTQARSTLGGIGVGATYRHWLGDSWILWTSISASRPIGDLTRLVESRYEYRSEIGVKWLGRFRLTE